jgi:hypothetical protein
VQLQEALFQALTKLVKTQVDNMDSKNHREITREAGGLVERGFH